MERQRHTDVECLPADLDRFLTTFFDRREWRADIKFDPSLNLLYLDVRLESPRLSDDDRFFSLVEYFSRAQRGALHAAGGLSFRCRLYDADGADLTQVLHQRGSAFLDDVEQGSTMRRRLAWLGFRRRLLRHVVPATLLWAGAVAVVRGAIGLPLATTIALAFAALAVQVALVSLPTARQR
jgi:hypothetical protein